MLRYVCMYVCLLRDVHTSILKMADFSPVHCLFLHLRSSNHIAFRSAGHFALPNQTIGIQILDFRAIRLGPLVEKLEAKKAGRDLDSTCF